MNGLKISMAALAAAALSTALMAQPGPGGTGPGPGTGMGPGKGHQMENMPGWNLMTPEERTAHQQKMQSFKTYDECKAYQAEHHVAMQVKAKAQGKTLPSPRVSPCDRLKAKDAVK